MLKVMTIVGTRPEIIRLSRIIPKLDEFFNHTLVHTGQNYDYELNEIFFDDLNLRQPDAYLNCAENNLSKTIGNILEKTDCEMARSKPDAILILGDTNSSLAAISAKRRKIPVFHMEAGNRCFDQRVPEEINRKIVDHISDINLPYSQISREHLILEGIKSDRIIVTGSPMDEVLHFYQSKINKSNVIKKLKLKKDNYFLVSAHREENVDCSKKLKKLLESLGEISLKYKLPIIFSTHPRTRKKIEKININFDKKINFVKPLCFTDYVHLQLNAKATLSDSGTITEESSILNFPALNLREVHERPEGFEEGAVMFTGHEPSKILSALNILDKQKRGTERSLNKVSDYKAPNVSEKIIRIIQSYSDFVKREVWKE